ncbi:MAG: alpha/beta fold hydrolase [Acidobacteriaceae bacterium]
MRFKACLLAVLAVATLSAQTSPISVGADPAPDRAHPATATEMTVPSHGQKLFGIFYAAAGAGNHPTVVLLHGFPGYEQNLDLAQAIRRAGWNVLALHYRGSWGVGGMFSLAHAMEDADAMVAFARSPAAASKYHIDRDRIVVIGHSMGGYIAASATAHEPAVRGTVMIGTWDITAPARGAAGLSRQELVRKVETARDRAVPADFLPLQGIDAHSLALEIVEHRDSWDLIKFAPGIAARPVLLLTADDESDPGSARLEQALKNGGNTHVRKIYTVTDHSFSGRRIYLQSLVLNWLAALPSVPAN